MTLSPEAPDRRGPQPIASLVALGAALACAAFLFVVGSTGLDRALARVLASPPFAPAIAVAAWIHLGLVAAQGVGAAALERDDDASRRTAALALHMGQLTVGVAWVVALFSFDWTRLAFFGSLVQLAYFGGLAAIYAPMSRLASLIAALSALWTAYLAVTLAWVVAVG